NFMVKILGCRGLPSKFTVSIYAVLFGPQLKCCLLFCQDIYVRFRVFVDEQYSVSEKVSTSVNPNMNFCKLFRFSHVTQQLIEYLKDGILNIEVWGRQLLKSGYSIPKHLSTDKTQNNQMLQEELAKH